jgi:hypothetical protein
MRISSLLKGLRRWSSQAFRKRDSPPAFRTCRNAGNSVLIAEGTTSKGIGNISCEAEFCIFYRLSLRTLRTKDVILLILYRVRLGVSFANRDDRPFTSLDFLGTFTLVAKRAH